MRPDVLQVLTITEIISQRSFCLPALCHVVTVASEPEFCSLQGILFTDGDAACGAYMLINGLMMQVTLLRLRIYGRVLTFRRSSNLSTGFGMYHNKQ